MKIYKESKTFYEGAYDLGKQVLFLALILFALIAPNLAVGLVREFNLFDLVSGILMVLMTFVWAIKASEYEEAHNRSKGQYTVSLLGRKFYVGQKYMHSRKWDVYRLIAITNMVNSPEFPITAVYQNEDGEVFSRNLFEFSSKFTRYDTEEE